MQPSFKFSVFLLLILSLLCILPSPTQAGLFEYVGGNFKGKPQELNQKLSTETKAWIDSLLAPLDSNRMADAHVHLLSLGHDKSGAFVNPELREISHPIKYAQFKTYLSAAQVRDTSKASDQSWARLKDLIEHHPKKGKFFLFAFDAHYSKQGVKNLELSTFYIPNELAWKRSQEDTARYTPVISVHPYRKDALAELDKWGARGVHYLKWLPNAMGIPPNDPRLIPFYNKMKEYNITLISHSGEEHAVDADDHQAYGNPLAFRLPLDLGVQVILAHAATTGNHHDLDNDPQMKSTKIPSYQLLARMLDESQYKDRLFIDLSAISLYNHLGPQVDTLLSRPDWNVRMIDGSDYPLPAVNFLVRTKQLEKQNYITALERQRLNEVYGYNPLLFDLLTKRVMKHPKTKKSLGIEAFHVPRSLPGGGGIRN